MENKRFINVQDVVEELGYLVVKEDWKLRRALRQHLLPEDLQAKVKGTPNGSSGQKQRRRILPLSCVGMGLNGRRKICIISIYLYWIIRSRSGRRKWMLLRRN